MMRIGGLPGLRFARETNDFGNPRLADCPLEGVKDIENHPGASLFVYYILSTVCQLSILVNPARQHLFNVNKRIEELLAGDDPT